MGVTVSDEFDATPTDYRRTLISKIIAFWILVENGIDIAGQLIIFAIIGFLVLSLFHNFDSKSLMEGYKFEIKKAKDIT